MTRSKLLFPGGSLLGYGLYKWLTSSESSSTKPWPNYIPGNNDIDNEVLGKIACFSVVGLYSIYKLYQFFKGLFKRPPDGHCFFLDKTSAYNAAKQAGGGREPVFHKPHKPGGSPHYHVAGHGLVDGVNMHYNF